MKPLFLLTLLALSLPIFSHENNPKHFSYQILATDKTSSTVTKQNFDFLPRLIQSLYSRELQIQKIKLTINTEWENPYFTAWAHKESQDSYSLNFWGGLARIPGMSDDGHALVSCHELGHVLGQGPKHTLKDFLWASSEGQSDYFATGLCLKRYYEFKNRQSPLPLLKNLPEVALRLCQDSYDNNLDYRICLHSTRAIMDFRSTLIHLNQDKRIPQLDSPASDIASQTIRNSYPSIQCRIDTLFQGALCPTEDYPCQGQEVGARPLCWFRN